MNPGVKNHPGTCPLGVRENRTGLLPVPSVRFLDSPEGLLYTLFPFEGARATDHDTSRKSPKRPPQPGPEGRRQGRRHRAGQAGPARRRRFRRHSLQSAPRPRPARRHRPGPPDQGQRQPRHVAGFPSAGQRAAEGQDQPRLRRRRPDGPEHGRRPEEDPQDHPGPDAHPGGDGAHLPGGRPGHRPAGVHRRHDRRRPLRGRRVAGPRGRRLHDRPQRPDPEGRRPAEEPGPGRRRRVTGRGVPRRLDAPQRKRESLLRPLRPPARDRPAPRRHPQPGRRPAARLHPRRDRPAADRGAADPGRAGQAGPGGGGPGHGRGAGPRPARPGRDEHAPGEARLRRARPSMCSARSSPTSPRATTTSSRPSAGPWPRRPGPISSVTSRRPSTSACPSDDDVREGLIASKIAAHAGDIVKGVPGALERDLALARARKRLDWETQRRLSIDPVKFAAVRKRRRTRSKACSMCGDFCAMRIVGQFLGSGRKTDDDCA